MAIVIQDIVQVSIAGQPKPIFLRPDLIWKGAMAGDPVLTYVKLLKGRSEINRLLGQPLRSNGKDKRKLQYTSIIETLTQLRNDRIKSMVEESKSKEQKIDFDIDQSGRISRRRQFAWEKESRQSAALPKIVEIDGPAIGDTVPIKMKVRVDQPKSPLFVELTQKSIDYLVSAIKHQIDNGDIHRKAKRLAVDGDEKSILLTGFIFLCKETAGENKEGFFAEKAIDENEDILS